MNPTSVRKIIKEIDDSRIVTTTHCEARMIERGFDLLQIVRCLRKGNFKEEPYRNGKGNWQFSMTTVTSGDPVTAVAVLEKDETGNYIVVITVFGA